MTRVEVGADVGSFLRMMDSLFQTSQVHLRELLQNALEATFQAVRAGAPAHPIRITTSSLPGGGGTLRIADRGLGMTAEELARNLGRVFFSGWPTAPGETLGLGQFGFGFFTVFLAADHVEVVSRALHQPQTAHRWSMDRGADHATVERLTGEPPDIGTTVTAYFGTAAAASVEPEAVLANLREQYLYLPYPVFVDDLPLGLPGVEGWRESTFGRGSTIGAELQDRYGWPAGPLLVEPLDLDNGGLLFVVPEGVTAPPMEIYRRGVRVTAQEIVPEPLNMFIGGLVDMTEVALKPDRERLREDHNFDRLRDRVREGALALLARAAERRRATLAEIFDAHGTYLTAAMRESQTLRRALGLALPMPLYFPDPVSGDTSITLAELARRDRGGTPGSAGQALQWAHDRGADQLFADRARYLGVTTVFLADSRLRGLVEQVCRDHRVTLHHVAAGYLRDVERTLLRADRLGDLFADVVGDRWEVICVEDVDSRMPLRFVAPPAAGDSSPGRSDGLEGSSPGEFLAVLDRLFASGSNGHPVAEEPPRLMVVNLRNDLIRDLRAAVEDLGRDPAPPALRRFAEVMVWLARLSTQTGLTPRDLEQLNNSVLELIHDRIRPASTTAAIPDQATKPGRS